MKKKPDITESEGYLQAFDLINDMIFVHDAETGQPIYVNRITADAFGYSRDEFLSLKVGDWTYEIPGFTQAKAMEVIKEAAAGEPQLFEWPAKTKEGNLFWVEVNLKKAILGDRSVVLAVVREITDRKKVEAQLLQAQKMEAIGTLAGGIAHDFNNLLMAALGNVSLMLCDMDSTHPHYKYLKNIEKQIESGAQLTIQLLGYARGGKYDAKPVSMNNIVNDIAETFARTRKDTKIYKKLAEDLYTIEADQGQIEQVLLNMFVNATDAMPDGGDLTLKTMNVTHENMKDSLYDPIPGNYVLLTIADTGSGMAKETLEQIFDPFFTTKEMGRGTGLGLASVFSIIKNHGGYIDVDSEFGKGTTFKIYLPATEKTVRKTSQANENIIQGNETVLVVDDEPMVLDMTVAILNKLGYTAIKAGNGRAAIETYTKNKDRIDMVLLDIIMPDMGGGEVYDRMKEINPNVKVLLSSGYSIDSRAEAILARGCKGFIQKPIGMKDFAQSVRKILQEK